MLCSSPRAASPAEVHGREQALQQVSTEALWATLRLVAPGTPLREGIDRILQANMGALIVVGDGADVLSICSGGFPLGVDFTPQRFSELAKMDGAIILGADTRRISRANVHLVPDPDIPTSETGTRHRTAERVARQLAVPVVTISEEMSVVSVHVSGQKKTLERIPHVLARSDQALQILGRYRLRLDTVTGSLSALEVEDLVTVRDVADVLQRAEMVRRIADEVEGYVIELGTDGRLVQLQLEELTSGVDADLRLVLRDYFVRTPERAIDAALARLDALSDDDVLDVARARRGAPPPVRHRPRLLAHPEGLPRARQDPAPVRRARRAHRRPFRQLGEADAGRHRRPRRDRRHR